MNVLVVDDEPIMREAYKSLIDWNRSGFNFVGSADNGAEALKMMRKTKVDVVITDLKMPVMSGLELIEAARAEFPHVKFIVMSAYDDFVFVKEAYGMGVKEYFLKAELDPDAVLETLFNVKEEIMSERTVASRKMQGQMEVASKMMELSRLEKIVHNNRVVLCEHLLKELIWGTSYETSVMRLEEYGVSLKQNALGLMVISLYDYYEEEKNTWHGEREMFKYAILNVLDELCQNYGNLYPFCNFPYEFVILSSEFEENYSNKDLGDFFIVVKESMKKCFGLHCDCGYSGPVTSYAGLKVLYQEAESACRYGFVCGHGSFVRYKSLNSASVKKLNVSKCIQNMKIILSNIEYEGAESALCKLRISPDVVGRDDIDDVKNIFYLYYVEIMDFFVKNGMESRITDNIKVFSKIRTHADLSDYNNWLNSSLRDIYDIVNQSASIVVRAKNYIYLHYKEQINLTSVADFLGISAGYLSRIFQESEGQSFKQYLQNFRMNQASALLKTTNLKVYEVAREVGYTNPEQFSKMFKKIIGKPPKSFGK